MGIVHVLDARVANQIAAGEVIERPFSAVKELIENSLDANAKNITVEIDNGGLDLIKITDDGDGFYKDDLPLAIKRHATSKISDFNDVYRLNTFGFRGEALASIAAISRLRITSGRNNTEPANMLDADANGNTSMSVAAPRKGTCIEIKDLYYNVPARKKFVKSNSHESALIYDLICKFSLGFPELNFTYYNNKEVIFSSNQLKETDELLHYIYGNFNQSDIIHFKHDGFYQGQNVEGWFLPTTVTRSNRNHMTYFVNDRLIESKELDYIIDDAMDTLIPKGRFMVCVLKLYVPAFNIDVNIHPSKKVIKFKNLSDWRNNLVSLIKEELYLSKLNVKFGIEPKINEFKLQQEKIEPPVTPQKLSFSEPKLSSGSEKIANNYLGDEFQEKVQSPDNRFSIYDHEVQNHENFDAAEPIRTEYAVADISDTEENFNVIENDYPMDVPISNQPTHSIEDNTMLKQSDLSDLDYIGQLNRTFILAQDKDNLYVIDQHTLHERILYEKFMKEFNSKKIVQQPLLNPLIINVSPMQEDVLIKNIMTLNQLGFIIEQNGTLSYKITAIPVLLSHTKNFTKLFLDLLDNLYGKDIDFGLAKINEERIIMASCKAAVKAHYLLTESEVRYLIKQLSTLENAHTCPHGRPIIMNISMNEIYLFFKRGSY